MRRETRRRDAAKSARRPAAKKAAASLPNVELRRPRLPAAVPGSGLSNPIDLLLQAHLKSVGVDLSSPCPDAVFARRVYLDLVGLLPPPAELDAFRADSRPDKRTLLVRQLLGRREDYAVHWLAFWNDLLRNEYRGTGFIDDGRRQITRWLFRALYDNQPYDRFVHELVSPVPGSEGFVKGIEWRGVVNASQRREMQAAQTTAQVFLGTNLKCASCHDSFVSQWTLADSHGLAAVFADGPLDIYRCDKATGQHARAKFLFPELGTIDADAPRPVRMKQLADRITDRKNGRLAQDGRQPLLGPPHGPRIDRAAGQHGTGSLESRAARLAGCGFRRPRLRPQTHFGSHLHVAHLSASVGRRTAAGRSASLPSAVPACGE